MRDGLGGIAMMRRHAIEMCLLASVLSWQASAAQTRIVDVRQGTDMALSKSARNEEIVIDLLGQLWRMPSRGGGAIPLTPIGEHAKHPRHSPDGSMVVYQRRAGELWSLWILDLTTGERRPLVDDQFNNEQADFLSPGSIVFVSDRSGNRDLWAIGVDSGEMRRLTSDVGDVAFPTVSSAGAIAYVRHDSGGWSLRTRSATAGNLEIYRSSREISAPAWRPGGGVILFLEMDGTQDSRLKMLVLSDDRVVKTLTAGEDVFAARPAWLSPAEYLYTADGQIWRRGIASQRRSPVHLFAAVPVPESTFDGRSPAEAPTEPGAAVGLAGTNGSHDGSREVVSALGDLWLIDSGGVRQLTDDAAVDIDPALMPDEKSVVFASDRDGTMRLWQLDLTSGRTIRLTQNQRKAYRPTIDPTGRRIAYLETDGLGPWATADLKLLDLERGSETVASAIPGRSQPLWRVTESGATLDIAIPTDANSSATSTLPMGTPSGGQTEQRLSHAPRTDAPQAMPTARQPSAPERYVVQIGRLFDGIRGGYRRHMDVHVEGNRIVAIAARGALPLPDTVIDARDSTMIPGFIDVHAHQSDLMGSRLGKIWLAHGVTTVREIAFVYAEANARREAWAAGRTLGPRLVVSVPQNSSQFEQSWPAGQRILDGPVHDLAEGRSTIIFGGTGQEALLAGQRQPLLPLDLRYSPLQIQYQDVFSTIAAGSFVTTTGLAASAPPETLPKLSAGSDLARLAAHFYTRSEWASWTGPADGARGSQPRQNRIMRLIRSGARVAIGSDAPFAPYGLGFHFDMLMLAKAGIAADQILRIATAEGAMALGLDRDLGTLETGKLADFLIIDGDPLQRLEDLQKIRKIAVDGHILDRASLLDETSQR